LIRIKIAGDEYLDDVVREVVDCTGSACAERAEYCNEHMKAIAWEC
jgi:hypothetical protein